MMGRTVEVLARGQTATGVNTGDFLLTHRKGVFPVLIHVGQRRRYPERFAHWTHAALVYMPAPDPLLLEALPQGVTRTHLSDHRDEECVLVRTHTLPADQQHILAYCDGIAGERYGWATICCIAIALATSGGFTFGFQGQAICSGLVARACERAGAFFGARLPENIMPADLAAFYGVNVPRR